MLGLCGFRGWLFLLLLAHVRGLGGELVDLAAEFVERSGEAHLRGKREEERAVHEEPGRERVVEGQEEVEQEHEHEEHDKHRQELFLVEAAAGRSDTPLNHVVNCADKGAQLGNVVARDFGIGGDFAHFFGENELRENANHRRENGRKKVVGGENKENDRVRGEAEVVDAEEREVHQDKENGRLRGVEEQEDVFKLVNSLLVREKGAVNCPSESFCCLKAHSDGTFRNVVYVTFTIGSEKRFCHTSSEMSSISTGDDAGIMQLMGRAEEHTFFKFTA